MKVVMSTSTVPVSG